VKKVIDSSQNYAKTTDFQAGEFPGWDRAPVAFIKTRAVSQFATIATTCVKCEKKSHFS